MKAVSRAEDDFPARPAKLASPIARNHIEAASHSTSEQMNASHSIVV